MIVLSNSNAQTVAPGQAVTFDTRIMHTGCAECWRIGSGAIGLKCQGIYECQFTGNCGTGTLALALDSAPLTETTMNNSGADVANIHCSTAVKNCCGNDSITVINTGTEAVELDANPCLFIKRIA